MNVILIILSFIIMLVGLIGTALPVLPGIPLIWLVFLGYGIFDGWESYGLLTMIIATAAMVLSLALDQLASILGAKRFGATMAGIIGSIAGGLAGLLVLNFPGLILGAFAGAGAGEMLFGGQNFKSAAQAGAGAIVGLFLGGLAKFIIGVVMIGAFAYKVVIS